MYINSYYNLGYTEGLAQTLNSISIKYTYHTHINKDGNIYPDGYIIYGTNAPGGCFSVTSHTHNMTGTCGTETETYGPPCGCTNFEWNGWGCSNCRHKEHDDYCHRGIYERTVYTCGSPINTWALGCEKTESSIEKAEITFQ